MTIYLRFVAVLLSVVFGFFIALLATHPAKAAVIAPQISYMKLKSGRIDVRVGVYAPTKPVVADLIYVHGFADRFDNHEPLFASYNEAGVRVIAFDLPGHGENHGISNFLGLWSIDEMLYLIQAAEVKTREDAQRPLLLAGWSTGGLIVTRYVQTRLQDLERTVRGVILYAPGVAVQMLPGKFGFVTQDTLTQNENPPHKAAPSPRSPLDMAYIKFSSSLLLQSHLAYNAQLPRIPTLVFSAGDNDKYVKSKKVREWVVRNRNQGVTVFGVSCKQAFHELDNEPYGIGEEVQTVSSFFALYTIGKSAGPLHRGHECISY